MLLATSLEWKHTNTEIQKERDRERKGVRVYKLMYAPFFSLIFFLAATKSLRRDPRSIPVISAA